MTPSTPLWQTRPDQINESISCAFKYQPMAACQNNFRNQEQYFIAEVDEHKLAQYIIEKKPDQKKFTILDIGSTSEKWAQNLADFISTLNFSTDVKVEIYSLYPRNDREFTQNEQKKCSCHYLNNFNIENITHELSEKQIEIAGKVDLIVSSRCFENLVDPVGTFEQTYDLLNINGYLLIDGFKFQVKGDSSTDYNDNVAKLFLKTKSLFLTQNPNIMKRLNCFILKKTSDTPLNLGLKYHKTVFKRPDQFYNPVTTFISSDQDPAAFKYEGDFRGSKKLYEELLQNEIILTPSATWGPLLETENELKTPLLHQLIKSRDIERVKKLLKQEDIDINESDSNGFTPLHLAIKNRSIDILEILLEKKPNLKLFACKKSPLHLAVEVDFEGNFVKKLIEAGSDINLKPDMSDFPRHRPIELAIIKRNTKAIELLLESSAYLSYKYRKMLNEISISLIIKDLIHELESFTGFEDIKNAIMQDKNLFFTEDNSYFGYITKAGAAESEVIKVNVSPNTRFLIEGNHKEFEDLFGIKLKRCNSREIETTKVLTLGD